MTDALFRLTLAAIIHPPKRPDKIVLVKTPHMQLWHLPTTPARRGVALLQTLRADLEQMHRIRLEGVSILSTPCATTETIVKDGVHEVTLYYDAILEPGVEPRCGNYTLAWSYADLAVAVSHNKVGMLYPRHATALRQALDWNLP